MFLLVLLVFIVVDIVMFALTPDDVRRRIIPNSLVRCALPGSGVYLYLRYLAGR